VIDDLELPLDEDELDELNERLLERAEEDSLLLDGLHGLVTAAGIGPGGVQPPEWMPMVLDPGRPFATTEDAERLVVLVLRLSNMVARDLDRLAFEPILGQVETEEGEAAYTARGWCEGFAMGIDVRADAWERALRTDPEFERIMRPIVALAADEGVFAGDDGEEPAPLSEAEYEEALNALPAAVLDVHAYWREHAGDAGAPAVAGIDVDPGAQPATPARTRAGRLLH